MDVETFKAISHPFRKHVLETLADGQPHATSSLIEGFPMTKGAVSQHLKILRESHLVIEVKTGRHKHYCLDSTGVADVLQWAETFQAFWTGRMRNLNTYLEKQHGED